MVDTMDGTVKTFSQSFACPDCQISIDEIEPRSFSFNNPFGACPDCFGLGYKMEFDIDLMIPDKSLSISQGAIVVMGCSPAQIRAVLQEQYLMHWRKNTIQPGYSVPGLSG